MQVGELARATGVSTDAIRLYEARGLIRSIRRPNGYRHFPPDAEVLVRLIRQAQGLGFTLAEVGEVLQGLSGELPAAAVRALLEDRLARVDAQMASLTRVRGLLQTRLDQACALGLGTQA